MLKGITIREARVLRAIDGERFILRIHVNAGRVNLWSVVPQHCLLCPNELKYYLDTIQIKTELDFDALCNRVGGLIIGWQIEKEFNKEIKKRCSNKPAS